MAQLLLLLALASRLDATGRRLLLHGERFP